MEQSLSKIKSREEITKWRLAQTGKKIAYTSGVFDLLHAGHIEYLEAAARECDGLIVGINSDVSVKQIKGELRPICGEKERARVVAALQCVSQVFIFDESNNNKNVELLKPDLYVKASEYSKEKLTSGSLVEQYGGKVLLIPYKVGFSSSTIINTISERFGSSNVTSIDTPPPKKAPAIFIDRDGTLVEEVQYLHEVSKLKVFEGAFGALKRLRGAGFRIVIVTNQPGIGLGYFTKEDFFSVSKEFLRQASEADVNIDKIYFCPHSKAEQCKCRKPATALIERAVKELNVDLEKSFVIGDMTSDIKLGRNANCRTALVMTGSKGQDGLYSVKPDFVGEKITDVAQWILGLS